MLLFGWTAIRTTKSGKQEEQNTQILLHIRDTHSHTEAMRPPKISRKIQTEFDDDNNISW